MAYTVRTLLMLMPILSISGFVSLHQIKKNGEKGHIFALWSANAIFILLALYTVLSFSISTDMCTGGV
jgi:hypothetical protein